jgi:hypothetical protein
MNDKPKSKDQLFGQGKGGIVFDLLDICSKELEKAGQHDEVEELQERVFESDTYKEALMIVLDRIKKFGEDLREEGNDDGDNEEDRPQ